MKLIILVVISIVLLFVPSGAFATGNMHVDSYCEDGIFHAVIEDQDGNPIENASVYTMKDRSDIEKKFFTDENGIVKITNEENMGMIKIVKGKFYDQTYPTNPCEIITPEIPSWVKNNAVWWADGVIDDNSFVSGIQFLIENSILKIPPTRVEVSATSDSDLQLPSWVKNNAKWWAEEKVSESEFISSMQFLVKNNIIKIPEKKVILDVEAPVTSSKTSVSGGSIVSHKEAMVIFLIYTTHNPSCSPSEVKMMEKYQQITEEYMKEQNVGRKVIVNEACLQMNEIDASMYPLLLAQFNVMRPDLMVFVGDLTSNFDLYYEEEAYGVWACMAFSSGRDCTTSVIVICECAPLYDEVDTNGGVWVLSHELGHFLFNYKNYGPNVYADAVHVVEYFYRECLNDGFTSECEQYYTTKEIDGKSYNLMNLELINSDYRSLLAEIPSIEKELQLLNLREFELDIQGETKLNPQDKQSIELTIHDGDIPVDGAAVFANIIDSKGNVVNEFQAISQNNGKYMFSWNLGSDTKTGSYRVIISISHEDYISKKQFFNYIVE